MTKRRKTKNHGLINSLLIVFNTIFDLMQWIVIIAIVLWCYKARVEIMESRKQESIVLNLNNNASNKNVTSKQSINSTEEKSFFKRN